MKGRQVKQTYESYFECPKCKHLFTINLPDICTKCIFRQRGKVYCKACINQRKMVSHCQLQLSLKDAMKLARKRR